MQLKDEKRKEEFLSVLNECQAIFLRMSILNADRSADSIDDLYQEMASNLWEAYPHFRNDCSITTFAYRVAVNTIYMYRRRRRRMPTFITLEGADLENIADTDGDEMIETLYNLIGRLEKEEQALLSLYIEKRSQKEIAQILCISENAVNQRIKRLKHKLRKMYENDN